MNTYNGETSEDVKFIKTGEFRPPKKGEYFLSGATPFSYLCYNNMTTDFYIMRKMKPAETLRKKAKELRLEALDLEDQANRLEWVG